MKKFVVLPVFVVFALFTFSCGGGGGGGSSSGGGSGVSFMNLWDNALLPTRMPVEISTTADIRRVNLLIDNVVVATDNSSPFDDLMFYSTTLSTGSHRVSVEAYDNTSNPPAVASVNVWVDAAEIRRRAMNILHNYCWGQRNSSGLQWNLTVWRFVPTNLSVSVSPVLASWGGSPGTANLIEIEKATKIWSRYTGLSFSVSVATWTGNIIMDYAYTYSNDAMVQPSAYEIVQASLYFPMPVGRVPSQAEILHRIGHVFFDSDIERWATNGTPSVMSLAATTRMDFAITEAVRILYTELHPGSVI